MGAVGEPNGFQHLLDACSAFGRFCAVQQERHLHIFVGGQCRDEREELKDEPNRSFAQVRPLVAIETSGVLSVDEYLATGGLVKQTNQL